MQTNFPALIPVRLIENELPIDAVPMPDRQRGATMASLCALLDIDKGRQVARIKRNPGLSAALVLMVVETPGGPQPTDVLQSWAISIWAAGLHISRLPERKRALALILQQKAFTAIEHIFAQPENDAPAQPLPPQPPVPQSVWQEGHAFLDHLQDYLEVKDETMRREFHAEGQVIRRELQQEFRNHLAEVEQQLRRELMVQRQQPAQPPPITASEAGEVRSTLGSFAERLVQINLLAARARQKYGYPIAMTLAGLAERFQVADVFDLPDKDWPAVLDWFAALLEE